MPLWRQPTPRAAARMLLAGTKLAELDQAFTAALCADPALGPAIEQTRAFVEMVRNTDVSQLEPWLENARGGPLRGFAEGLGRGRAAVEAALRWPWSTSPIEGRINKLKLLRRSMHGRGKLDRLRRRLVET